MMKEKTIPLRKNIPAKYKWNIKSVYLNRHQWEADFKKLTDLLARAKDFQGKLGESAEKLAECIEYQEELGKLLDKLYLYASMKQDEDNNDAQAQSLKSRIQGLAVRASTELAFFTPELLALDNELIDEYMKADCLQPYLRMLQDILRFRPYTLSAEEERIVAMTGEMAEGAHNIFSLFNNADLQFPAITNEKGEQEQLSHGNYIRFMESPNRNVRKSAFEALYSQYGKYRNSIAAMLNTSVQREIFSSKVHKYPSALFASLYNDNISVSVYEKLIRAVRQNLPVFFEYLEVRKDALQVDELHFYDIYAPLVPEVEWDLSYEDAVKIVKKALAPLGEEYVADLTAGLKAGWVDVFENKGKTSGAHSTGIYGSHPFVLLNHQPDLNSVFTLAHELGHSMHSYYSWKNQPYTYAYYRIFVAEVASTVNEILLCEYLLENAKTDKERMSILNRYLEEFRGTVFRQTMFAEFEKIIHEKAEQGEPLTAQSLSDIYFKLNRDYFGKNMHMDEEIALEWARIPHFYRDFYVYKYATGFCAAQALASGILQGGKKGEQARQNYLKFLAGGGSMDPLDLLRLAGVDMETPKPINKAMQEFARKLEMFKELQQKQKESAK